MTRPAATSRRATSLIEAVVVVVVLAVSVPPTVCFLQQSADRRSDALMIARAESLASSVLEQVLSDSVSQDVGSSVSTYVDTAGTGLRARLAAVAAPATAAGITWTLAVGARVNAKGVTSGDSSQDVFRVATVTVTYPTSTGAKPTLPLSVVVSCP